VDSDSAVAVTICADLVGVAICAQAGDNRVNEAANFEASRINRSFALIINATSVKKARHHGKGSISNRGLVRYG